MKILFYIPVMGLGGYERVVTNLIRMLSAKNYDVVLVSDIITESEYQLHMNVEREILNLNKFYNAQTHMKKMALFILRIPKLRRVIKKVKPDVALGFITSPIFTLIMASRLLHVPIIISQRNDPKIEAKNILRRFIFKYIYPLADACVFQTKEMQEFFSLKLQRKSLIINNLVDNHFFDTRQTTEKKNIVGVGRLEPQKNWYVAIKAFSLISKMVNDDFHIYGKGQELDNLKKYTEELSVSDRVIFKGTSDEIENIVVNSRLFVLSSDYEGVSNALIEALVMGVPCVSTKFTGGGAELLIESGVNGILVPKENSEAMAEAMLKILKNEEFAERLGKNAKEKAQEFRPEKVFQHWEKLILSTAKEA